ncbi:MAG: hypothetical protein R8G66_06075 [Cytophagales bacterium]|nr:hypothetical protein [Cytophagales bacterium]
MTNKDLIKAGCLLGGILGLGFITYLVFKEEDDENKQDEENTKDTVNESGPVIKEKVIKGPTISKLNTNSRANSGANLSGKKKSTPASSKESLKVSDELVYADQLIEDEALSESSFIEEPDKVGAVDLGEVEGDLIYEELEVSEQYDDLELSVPEADEFPLRAGSTGPRVERLQVWLMRNYGYFGKISGAFDDKTLAKVQKHLGSDTVDENTFNRYRMSNHVTEQVIVRT